MFIQLTGLSPFFDTIHISYKTKFHIPNCFSYYIFIVIIKLVFHSTTSWSPIDK